MCPGLSHRRRPLFTDCRCGVSLAEYCDLSHRSSVRWTVLLFWRIVSIRYWLTAVLVGCVRKASVEAFFTDWSANASGLCRRQLNASTWIAIIKTGPQALNACINMVSVTSSLWMASMTSKMSSLSGASFEYLSLLSRRRRAGIIGLQKLSSLSTKLGVKTVPLCLGMLSQLSLRVAAISDMPMFGRLSHSQFQSFKRARILSSGRSCRASP